MKKFYHNSNFDIKNYNTVVNYRKLWYSKNSKFKKVISGNTVVIPLYYRGYTVVGRGEIEVKYFILVN
jgi:hypothetical protein